MQQSTAQKKSKDTTAPYISIVLTCSTTSTYSRFRTVAVAPGMTLNKPFGPMLKVASPPSCSSFTDTLPVAREQSRSSDCVAGSLCEPPGLSVMTLKPMPGTTGTATFEKR